MLSSLCIMSQLHCAFEHDGFYGPLVFRVWVGFFLMTFKYRRNVFYWALLSKWFFLLFDILKLKLSKKKLKFSIIKSWTKCLFSSDPEPWLISILKAKYKVKEKVFIQKSVFSLKHFSLHICMPFFFHFLM